MHLASSDQQVQDDTPETRRWGYELRDELRALPCLHRFHAHCIESWEWVHAQTVAGRVRLGCKCPNCNHPMRMPVGTATATATATTTSRPRGPPGANLFVVRRISRDEVDPSSTTTTSARPSSASARSCAPRCVWTATRATPRASAL